MFEKYGRKSRLELFLDGMEQVVPWAKFLALVEPYYAKAGKGRKPVGSAIMLRTYFVQQWFNLSAPGVSPPWCGASSALISAWRRRRMRRPSCASGICWEKHSLGGQMLETVNEHLESKGIRIQTGTIVDASIIHAPSSTKNEAANATRRCIRRRRATSGSSG